MRSPRSWMALAVFAAFACQKPEGPVAPVEEVAGPTMAVAACPCWDEATLATAFPAVHAFVEGSDASALTRFDLENAQQIQALVRFALEGSGECELASFGTGGLVEALSSAAGLSPAQCEACAAFLEVPAAAHGFLARPAEGEVAD
jgi:hypothetical protein